MKTNFVRFLRGFVFAFAGVLHVAQTERNMRVHIVITVCGVLLGIYLRLSLTEWAVIALAISGVFSSEIMNSSIEHLTDLVSPEQHELAKVAKDAAAGAVLVNAIFGAIAGVVILAPKLAAVISR